MTRESTSAQLERYSRLRSFGRGVVLLGTLSAGAVAGGKLFAERFGNTEGKVCAVTVEVEHDVFDTNKTPAAKVSTINSAWIEFPNVHSNPFLKTSARVTDVDEEGVTELRELIDSGNEDDITQYESRCRRDAKWVVQKSVGHTILAGTSGALLGSMSAWGCLHLSSRVKRALRLEETKGKTLIPVSLLLAGAPALGSIAWAAGSFHDSAAKQPVYRGYFEDLENTVDLSKVSLEGYQQQGREFTRWIEQVAKLQESLASPEQTPNYVTILSISDIHSRPCAYERVQLLADAVGADFITNEGDEVEWDERESGLLVPADSCNGVDGPGDVDREIIQVEGNHDNDAVMDALDALSNVDVLDGETKTVSFTNQGGTRDSVRILGVPDRRYEADDVLQGRDEIKSNLISLLTDEEIQTIARGEYDILMAHDPKLVKELEYAGLLPDDIKLVSTGHTHKNKVDLETADVPILTTGSSGGGGLRSFERSGQPSEYSVIYLDPDTKDVVRISLISVTNQGEISIRNVDMSEG